MAAKYHRLIRLAEGKSAQAQGPCGTSKTLLTYPPHTERSEREIDERIMRHIHTVTNI